LRQKEDGKKREKYSAHFTGVGVRTPPVFCAAAAAGLRGRASHAGARNIHAGIFPTFISVCALRARMKSDTTQLLAYIERNAERILAQCTGCGKCFDACPMTRYSDMLPGQPGREAVAGVLDILRGGTGTPAAVEWTRLCTQSAVCIPACPEKIDPMLMLRLARITALGSTGAPALLPDTRRDPDFFRRINAFAALQLSEAEIEWWQR
jgi:ferredoxin